MNIPKHNRKLPYELGHFTEDCVARDWINERFEEGYVLDALTTKVVVDSRDKRKQVVEITIIMRLDLPGGPPPAPVPAPSYPPCLSPTGYAHLVPDPAYYHDPMIPLVPRPHVPRTLRDIPVGDFVMGVGA